MAYLYPNHKLECLCALKYLCSNVYALGLQSVTSKVALALNSFIHKCSTDQRLAQTSDFSPSHPDVSFFNQRPRQTCQCWVLKHSWIQGLARATGARRWSATCVAESEAQVFRPQGGGRHSWQHTYEHSVTNGDKWDRNMPWSRPPRCKRVMAYMEASGCVLSGQLKRQLNGQHEMFKFKLAATYALRRWGTLCAPPYLWYVQCIFHLLNMTYHFKYLRNWSYSCRILYKGQTLSCKYIGITCKVFPTWTRKAQYRNIMHSIILFLLIFVIRQEVTTIFHLFA